MLALAWLAVGLAVQSAKPPGQLAGAHDTVIYVVKQNETLLDISHRGFEPASGYREVERLNHIVDDRRVAVGFRLRVPRALLKTTPILATVEGVHGAATAAGGALAVGRTLSEGAVVLTGENAFVRLGLPDGSHLAIPSNSRVRLDRLRAVVLTGSVDRQISVQAGSLDSQVTPMTDPSSRFVVVTPVAQSAVRGTEFHVAYDGSQSIVASSVFKGAVGVSNPKAQATAQAGQGAVATPSGVKGPVALLPAPQLETAYLLQSGERLHFAIKPVAGAARYHLRVAADAKVEAPLYDLITDKPVADLPAVPDGAYYLKLSAISRDTLEGLPAVIAFTRALGDLAIVGATRGADGQTEFRWSLPGETPATYHFVLMRQDDRQHPLLDKTGLNEAHIAVPGLAPGDYVWTVFAFRMVGGLRLETASDPQPLHVP